jgi:hypothetical protein
VRDPAATPRRLAAPSTFPEAAATTPVPGQYPETMKPAPRRRPPARCGQRNVSGIVRSERSTRPTPERSARPSIAVTMAENITFRTRVSVR